MTEIIQVVTTTSSKDEAHAIASALVTRHLAACVQVFGPISSIYRWQGNLESSQEWTCAIKTRRSRYQAVEDAIRALHSYEVPEILAFSVVDGNQNYLDWVAAQVVASNDS
jgi:periplasmic divalent cation tolerance protein